MKRKPLRRTGGLKRTSTLKTTKRLESRSQIKAKPKPARTKVEREASEIWKFAIVERGCEVCPKRHEVCDGDLFAHHAIYQQHLRDRGLDHLLWVIENGLCLCYKSHRRHHNRTQPIERKFLRPENIAFAEAHGLMDLVERYYV